MKKILNVILVIGIVVVLVIAGFVMINSNKIKLTPNNIFISRDGTKLNSETLEKEIKKQKSYSKDYKDIKSFKGTKDEDLGYLIEVMFRFDVKKIFEKHNFKIKAKVDTSQLEEQIFFLEYDSDESVFNHNEPDEGLDAKNGLYTVCLYGYLKDKSNEELDKLIEKLKITVSVQDSKNKMKSYTYNSTDFGKPEYRIIDSLAWPVGGKDIEF